MSVDPLSSLRLCDLAGSEQRTPSPKGCRTKTFHGVLLLQLSDVTVFETAAAIDVQSI